MRARDNPFRSEKIERLGYRLEGTTWTELLARCERLNYRCAVVGRYGSGKTTFLEELEKQLQGARFRTRLIRLRMGRRVFVPTLLNRLTKGLTRREILLFDSAGQLNYAAWHWLRWNSRHARGLIITVHKPGRLPTLWECRTSSALLAELLAHLLDCCPDQVRHLAANLCDKHDGNLREAFRECYDNIAQQAGIGGFGFVTDTRPGATIVHI